MHRRWPPRRRPTPVGLRAATIYCTIILIIIIVIVLLLLLTISFFKSLLLLVVVAATIYICIHSCRAAGSYY